MKAPAPTTSALPPVGLSRIKPTYRAGRTFFRVLGRYYFRWRVFNVERLPLGGRLLVAANHQSYFDPAIIGGALPRELYYLARKAAFRPSLAGAVLRAVNTIPVDSEGGPSAGLAAALGALRREHALLVFPEGTRSMSGEIHPFQTGVGFIAARAHAPVVPIRLFGLYEAYSRHHLFPRPRPITVKVGHPLHFDDKLAELDQASKAEQRLIFQGIARDIQAAVEALRPVPD
jgi:1-acyl-sn-glycerol-3-phosphate acyltransferase